MRVFVLTPLRGRSFRREHLPYVGNGFAYPTLNILKPYGQIKLRRLVQAERNENLFSYFRGAAETRRRQLRIILEKVRKKLHNILEKVRKKLSCSIEKV